MEKESLKIEEKDTFISIDIRLNTRVCKLAYKTSKDIIGRRFQSMLTLSYFSPMVLKEA